MPTKTILCSECEAEKKLIEASPNTRFVSCKPSTSDKRFCVLQYEFTFMAAPPPPPPPAGPGD
jgi:hypothetical protein